MKFFETERIAKKEANIWIFDKKKCKKVEIVFSFFNPVTGFNTWSTLKDMAQVLYYMYVELVFKQGMR